MSDRNRPFAGISLNLMPVATRIAVQFATLPILFASWTVEAVGSWLILFAVPAYIALIGSGFAGGCGTAALAAARQGDTARARSDFRAAWTISTGATAALALVFASAALFIIPSVVEHGRGLAVWDLAKAAAWLALYIFATGQMAIFDIPYRVAGRYSDHVFQYNATSLLEIVVIAAAVTFSDSLATLAMSLALFRCLAALWIYFSARKAAREMFERDHGTPHSGNAALWRPSLGFILLPLAFGLNLHAYLLLAGAAFGAAVAAGFVATRVPIRLLEMVGNTVFGLQAQGSDLMAGDPHEARRRMLATMTLVSLGVAALFALCLFAIGPWLQDLYTLGETIFAATLALVLVIAATLRALSAAPMAVLVADNAATPVAAAYLVGSVASLVLAVLLALAGFSLPVVLLPLILAEGSQLVPAMRRALAALDLSPQRFLASLTARERLEDSRVLWQAIAGKK